MNIEDVVLKRFYNCLYDLTEACYTDMYSSNSYATYIRDSLKQAKLLKSILDECGVKYLDNYSGYCGYEIDVSDLENFYW